MDKTIGYYLEKYSGFAIGIVFSCFVFSNWTEFSCLLLDKYYDIIIKLSASIFGFFLTILTLLINSSNSTITKLRNLKDFKRLIAFNRNAVFLCFAVIVYSIFVFLIVTPTNGAYIYKINLDVIFLKINICLHAFLCIWCAIDTLVFLRVFYEILSNV